MDPPFKPFRWDISKRHQLGSLVTASDDEFAAWLDKELCSLGRISGALAQAESPMHWLVHELNVTSARILALSNDGQLFFVGRSPESIFDYLSGILDGTTWSSRIHLLPFSMRNATIAHQAITQTQTRLLLERHLAALALEPHQIIQRKRPTVFVDLVASGTTLGNLVRFLKHWSDEQAIDWDQVRMKIRIIGLIVRTKTSPNTWRWWQHAEWVNILERRAIKNVAIPALLFHYLGAVQTKLTSSYHPGRWNDQEISQPRHYPATIMALHLALGLYESGRNEQQRKNFAQQLSALPAIRYRWFRDLMGEVNT
jgi:hypothetical protein